MKEKENQPKQTIQYDILSWGPCVMHLRIPEDFHKKLLEEAYASRVPKLAHNAKLAGILKEEYTFRQKEIFLPWLSNILGMYDAGYQRWKNEKYKDGAPEYVLTEMWVNFQKKHEFNPLHHHSTALSFVIYLTMPEEITQEQKEYKGSSGIPGGLGFVYGKDNRSITPKERDLYIFPAWLKHWVRPFTADVTRVSVSGNVADKIELSKLKKAGGNGKI